MSLRQQYLQILALVRTQPAEAKMRQKKELRKFVFRETYRSMDLNSWTPITKKI